MALIVDIKVIPGAGKSECRLDGAGKLRCYLKNPAQQGRANQELIKMFSKSLKIPQGDIRIVSGLNSRNKRIKIESILTFEQLLEHLEIEKHVQGTLF